MSAENSRVFGDIFAGVYGPLCQDKDYEAECDLQQAGLSLANLSSFPDLDRAPDETTWNILAVGRAI